MTSRYLPADAPLPPTLQEWPLSEFRAADFLKFLLRDSEVERRYRTGELPDAALTRLHGVLGGTPRFLEQMRQVLRTMPAAELSAELDKVALPSAAEAAAEPGRLQQARDAYCEAIFAERLYGELPAASQRMLSRAAVYGVAVTLEGLAAAAGADQAAAGAWRGKALIHSEAGGGPELWAVYGLLRGWLMAPERLPVDERRAAHRAAGEWLERVNKEDREGELGLAWTACLLEARTQYLAADAIDAAERVTGQICSAYLRGGLYGEIERLNAELLQRERRPAALGWIARAHLERADYKAARRHYQEAQPLQQEIGDRAGEAATWHGLATIDVNEGAYGAAREKFATSMRIKQEIGDRAGEVATFYQLGFLAAKQGKAAEGLRLVALCFLIDKALGHGDAESDFQALSGLASSLNYTQNQFDALLDEVAAAYQRDRGADFVRQAE